MFQKTEIIQAKCKIFFIDNNESNTMAQAYDDDLDDLEDDPVEILGPDHVSLMKSWYSMHLN